MENKDLKLKPEKFSVKEFHLKNLKGISNQTLESHFKLYEAYVNQTNKLNQILSSIDHEKKEDLAELAYSEIKRRLGFEYNGMILHELYFENLCNAESEQPKNTSTFLKKVEEGFGSFKNWKDDFSRIGAMRGIGWAICLQNPVSGSISNYWIDLHQCGHISTYQPLVVMDVWEHAFLLDYKASEKQKYIDAFFTNIHWDKVDQRLTSS